MARYTKYRILNNASEYYAPLRESRGLRNIRHYETPRLHNPTVRQRMSLMTTTHIWKYGDRYYNLAKQYYGRASYWWVIAWWNARPTEANVSPGNMIMIPLNLEEALQVLGAN